VSRLLTLLEGLDFDFIVQDILPSDRIGNDSISISFSIHARVSKQHLLFGLFDGRDWERLSEDQGEVGTNLVPFCQRRSQWFTFGDLG
jgi:hypothetical protein